MPKISVIMPCLNMVRYIRQCVDSVMNQTLTEMEILIIDAGSTDGTLDILQEYISLDPRIRIIPSDKRSYGYQVNLGIKEARGEYIAIVDTDDKIVPDMYEALYPIAVETGADYVKGTAQSFYTITDRECYQVPVSPFLKEEYGENGTIEVCPKRMPQLLTKDNFLWYGIYRNDFLKQVSLHESPGAAFQDLGGLLQTQLYARKAVYISKPVYEYRQDNINASTYNTNGFHFIWNEYTWAEQFLQGQPSEWISSFYYKLFLHFMDRMHAMAVSGVFWEEALPDMQLIVEKLKGAHKNGSLIEKNIPEGHWEDLCLLWNNPFLLFEKYKNVYAESRIPLQNIIKFLGRDSGVIFGCGRIGSFVHGQFLLRGLKNIAAYCDNNPAVQGSFQYDVEILSPTQAAKKFPEAKYIVANKLYGDKLLKQLLDLGIKRNNIMVYFAGTDMRLFRDTQVTG